MINKGSTTTTPHVHDCTIELTMVPMHTNGDVLVAFAKVKKREYKLSCTLVNTTLVNTRCCSAFKNDVMLLVPLCVNSQCEQLDRS